MRRHFLLVLGMLASFGLGAITTQALHAQAKPKAYTVSEVETLDAVVEKSFVPAVQAAQAAAGGHNLRTGGGRIVSLDGAPAPKRVAITEWESLEQARAFYKSKAWNDLPEPANHRSHC